MNYEQILSRRIQDVKPSGIRRFFDILEEMKDAISLGIGEPDFPTPWHIRDAGIYSLEKGFTKYTSNAGLAELRREIASYLARRFGLHYHFADQILVTVGGSEGIDLAIRCLVNPGDEVIVPVPSFVCYGPLVEMAGGTPVYLEMKAENEFRLTADELRSAITYKTKALVLPFPSNPTGGIMERADLEALAEVLRGTDIMVISDEIYAELTYGQKHVSFASLPRMKERTAYVGGFSKAFAMTGWRLGYVCAPPAIDEAIFKIHQYSILCAPITAQYAAVEALKDGFSDDFAAVEEMRDSYDRRRRFVVDSLRGAGLSCFSPRGAFYAFPSVKNTSLSGEEFANLLLKEQKVAVVPGSAFGTFGRDNVRISYATGMTALTEACGRISEFMSKFR